jgi:hypothetical protein
MNNALTANMNAVAG